MRRETDKRQHSAEKEKDKEIAGQRQGMAETECYEAEQGKEGIGKRQSKAEKG